MTAIDEAQRQLAWAANNGVAFDHGKIEAALFRRKKTPSTATSKVGNLDVTFNREATRWLGIWLDSQLTPKLEHRAETMKRGRNTMNRLRRLTGQMGLSPVSCRKVVIVCFQLVAMYGSLLESGATGYAVAWQNGSCWVGLKVHMGYGGETTDPPERSHNLH